MMTTDAQELERAKRILTELLADGPMPAREVDRATSEFDVSANVLRKAKEALKVKSVKESVEDGRWLWQLPDGFILPTKVESRPTQSERQQPERPPRKPRLPHGYETRHECYRCGKLHDYQQSEADIANGIFRQTICDPCKEKALDSQKATARRRLKGLRVERNRIEACDPSDPQLGPLVNNIEALTAFVGEAK
jgi:hypothetical protein